MKYRVTHSLKLLSIWSLCLMMLSACQASNGGGNGANKQGTVEEWDIPLQTTPNSAPPTSQSAPAAAPPAATPAPTAPPAAPTVPFSGAPMIRLVASTNGSSACELISIPQTEFEALLANPQVGGFMAAMATPDGEATATQIAAMNELVRQLAERAKTPADPAACNQVFSDPKSAQAVFSTLIQNSSTIQTQPPAQPNINLPGSSNSQTDTNRGLAREHNVDVQTDNSEVATLYKRILSNLDALGNADAALSKPDEVDPTGTLSTACPGAISVAECVQQQGVNADISIRLRNRNCPDTMSVQACENFESQQGSGIADLTTTLDCDGRDRSLAECKSREANRWLEYFKAYLGLILAAIGGLIGVIYLIAQGKPLFNPFSRIRNGRLSTDDSKGIDDDDDDDDGSAAACDTSTQQVISADVPPTNNYTPPPPETPNANATANNANVGGGNDINPAILAMAGAAVLGAVVISFVIGWSAPR